MTQPERNGAGRRSRPAPAGFSLDVRLWKVLKKDRKARPYQLRWVVGGKMSSAHFATPALAESRRSELWQAMRRGEAFHIATGLPESELRAAEEAASGPADVPWFEFCRGYLAARWRTSAAKTREGIADSLATVALALVETGPGAPTPEELRLAFRWGMVPAHADQEPPKELEHAPKWLAERSLPLSAFRDPRTLRDVQYRLSYKLDGTPAAGDTFRRRRRDVNTALEHAVQLGAFETHPLRNVRMTRPAVSDAVDPRVLVNPAQWQQLLTAVSYVGTWDRKRGRRLVAFFAVQYYAALRPAEAVGLREADCHLPETSWGLLTLRETRPVSGKKWTDTGERHEKRGLKARESHADRPVPIPPVLVAILRNHLAEFGAGPEGRLFTNERGGVVGTSTYWRVWREARALALTPDKASSPLAARPYDLRHTAITTWLNAGVPIAEVARRAGNSPEVIHRRYAGCIDGDESAINQKIEKVLLTGL